MVSDQVGPEDIYQCRRQVFGDQAWADALSGVPMTPDPGGGGLERCTPLPYESADDAGQDIARARRRQPRRG